MKYLLAYSDNKGDDWIPIASDLTETCHTWATKNLSPGNNYIIKVIATDGVNTEEDRSGDTFTLLAAIKAKVDIKPETINLKAKGLFTAFLSLAEPYLVADIDLSTVECEGAPAVKGTIFNKMLIVKFDRKNLNIRKAAGLTTFNVTGRLKDGSPFDGSDSVKLIQK